MIVAPDIETTTAEVIDGAGYLLVAFGAGFAGLALVALAMIRAIGRG